MSQEKTSLEIIAPSVEEAVSRGLSQLGLAQDAVDVEVLDSGSRGLFGLGSRQARVKLSIKPPVVEAKPEQARSEQPRVEQPRPEPVSTPSEAVAQHPAAVRREPTEKAIVTDTPSSQDDEHTLKVARETVSDLLDKMKVGATVTSRFIDSEDSSEGKQVLVDVQGDDLSILIGRRSETLNALQYIASLIVGKELEHWTPLVIDVQGYRARRDRQLRQLAHRMAEQAVQSGRKQVLEPMPPNERRVIHLELRDHPQVQTESTGEEPNRKVMIILKKQ